MELYDACVDAGLEIDHHESDLYIKDCPKARELLKTYPRSCKCYMFVSQIDGATWIDVPFAYAPYWRTQQKCCREMDRLQRTIESLRGDEVYCRKHGHFDDANMHRETADALERSYLTIEQSDNGTPVWAMCAGFNSSYGGDSSRLGSKQWEEAQ